MKLILTEKSSVAKEFSYALGGKKLDKSYLCNDYIICYARGHLLTVNSEECGSNVWDLNRLPFLPNELDYIPIDYWSKKKDESIYLNNIIKILDTYNIDEIIIATDAGREGEYIAQTILHYCISDLAKYKISRFWVSGVLNKQNILNGLKNLKSSEEMYGLKIGCYLRGYIDWLIGLNLTEGVTSYLHQLNKVGRLIIPTVSEIARRNKLIDNFKPTKYYTIGLEIKYKDEILIIDSNKEIEKDKDLNNYIYKDHNIIKNEETIYPSKLFSLVSLQKYMYDNFKFDVNYTHDLINHLYQTGFVSYPRTSSNYLDESFLTKNKVIDLLFNISDLYELNINNINTLVLSKGKLVFNNIEMNKYDHHALLINEVQLNEKAFIKNDSFNKDLNIIFNELLYNFIKRLSEYPSKEITTLNINFETDLQFKINSIKLLELGYLKYKMFKNEIDNYNKIIDLDLIINELNKSNYKLIILEHETKPPYRYTQSRLISWFEKYNIGTSITKFSTISKLLDENYIYQNSGYLFLTDKGYKIYDVFKNNIISTPEYTEKLEISLSKLELLDINLIKEYESNIKNLIKNEVTEMINYIKSLPPIKNICKCKFCNSEVDISGFKIYCKNCNYEFIRKISNIVLSNEQLIELITKDYIYVKGLWSKTKKKKYSTYLILTKEGIKFNFEKPN